MLLLDNNVADCQEPTRLYSAPVTDWDTDLTWNCASICASLWTVLELCVTLNCDSFWIVRHFELWLILNCASLWTVRLFELGRHFELWFILNCASLCASLWTGLHFELYVRHFKLCVTLKCSSLCASLWIVWMYFRKGSSEHKIK